MGKIYRTIQNDTFDKAAWKFCEQEHLCAMLMAVNPDYMDTLLFEAGVELNIPDYESKPEVKKDLPPWYEN